MRVWVVSALITACGPMDGVGDDSSTTPPTKAVVRFDYDAPVEVDPFAGGGGCQTLVGRTHIHPSWRDFEIVHMVPVGDDGFALVFRDVPLGGNSIRVSDPNACADNITGAVTRHLVRANGTFLTRAILTPGFPDPEPGFAFTVTATGAVYP